MRLFFAALIVLGSVAFPVGGRLLPLTITDVSLMLRAGDKPEVVQHELFTRHLAAPLSAADEAMLIKVGAPQALVDAIKSGVYAIPAEEAAAATAQRVTQEARRAAQAQQSREMDTLYQNQLTRSRTAPAAPLVTTHPIATGVKGALVCWKNGSLSHFEDEALEEKKLIGLYFSAHWCAPCRKFTPQLVQFYNRAAAQHPEFEIIFVSADRTPFAMETYMRDTQMPWPAIDYAKLASQGQLKQVGGDTIPSLLVIDASGKVVASSYNGTNYVGPEKAVADIEAIFGEGTRQMAQAR